jgi:hypothetical protein
MAGKVYKRQILLHSNSSDETEKLDLVIGTAKFISEEHKIPWNWVTVFYVESIIGVVYLYLTNGNYIFVLVAIVFVLLFLAVLLRYLMISQKKLNSKYRDSEEGLIKP